MAISYVGSDSAADNIGGVNPVITFAVAPQQGDIVVVFGGIQNQTDPAGVTTSGYTTLAAFNSATGGVLQNVWAGHKIMGASPDTSVTCKGGTSFSTYLSFTFRGADQGTQPDATTTTAAPAASTNPNPPSITTVTDNAVVLALGRSTRDTAITVPSGYNNLTQQNGTLGNQTVAGAWKAVSPAGAEDPGAFTNWASGAWCAASVAIRPAGAAAAVVMHPWRTTLGTRTGSRQLVN